MIRILRALSVAAAVLFLFFWMAGCRLYTSVGVDSDSRHGPYVTTHYYRARWIGDGSFWVGTGQYSFRPSPLYKLMPFDWGGRFFQQARLIEPRSLWNRFGFWRYRKLPPASATPDLMPRESWIAVPGWLPVIIFLLPMWRWRRQSRETDASSV